MSLGNAILVACLSISSVTGITQTVESYAELATYNLADVAHMSPLELAIRSNGPGWLQEGMQISAFEENFKYWTKPDLKWALMNDPVILPRETVLAALRRGFDLWDKASVFTFQEVSSGDQPDIKVEFVYEKPAKEWSKDVRDKDEDIAWVEFEDRIHDINGKPRRIQFAKTNRWVDRSRSNWRNFRFFALRAIGTALGMGQSHYSPSIMYAHHDQIHPGAWSTQDCGLFEDDVNGIRELRTLF